jgi:YggT family protein
VNPIGCEVAIVLMRLVQFYMVLMFVYAVVSWVPDLRGRWVYYLANVIEPVLAPVRRIIPPIGGFDIAFLVVLLILQLAVMPLIGQFAAPLCTVQY